MSTWPAQPHHWHPRDIGTAFLADLRDTVLADPAGRHGPLPPLLISMTLATGLVDAFSYLVLGHVFVANMTGNVVFLGFALAGAPGFSVAASLAATFAFAAGALLGGRLGSRYRGHRGRLHSAAAAAQAAFLMAAVILAVAGGSAPAAGYRYALIIALGICMGIQNASARTIAIPDLTTTVLTLTITGIAADSALAGGAGSKAGRRLVPVAVMLAGAVLGAALIRHAQAYDPLVIALVTIVAGAAVSHLLGRSDPPWVHPQPSPAPSPVTGPEAPMSVERTHFGHQTRYELHDDGQLACVLTYTADPNEPATWKILLPGPGGTEDLYGAEQFVDPDAARLRSWLSPIVGRDHAAELADAVDAAPPQPAAWRSRSNPG
jgi:uncharacterized membrane protein YoaK (UPF0700 family)